MDFSNFSIVNERMELKNKFNEKLNAHRTKRGAPPISEEDKELVTPGKKIKREEKKAEKKKKLQEKKKKNERIKKE